MKKIIPNLESLINSFQEENKQHLLNLFKIKDPHSNKEYNVEVLKQVEYIISYLLKPEIKCKSYIVENHYTDKFYLDDYLHYYASCHEQYKKNCKRIHFFKTPAKKLKEKFKQIFKENYNSELIRDIQNNYLGFVVIKPIPSIVGRTLLLPYVETNFDPLFGNAINIRHFFTLKNYKANLLGIPLSIYSLPFQQQDSVISACATTALWTVLEKTSSDYGYYTPTPYEIKSIARHDFTMKPDFPSQGLDFLQVINGIRKNGMEVDIGYFDRDDKDTFIQFPSLCYAFLRGGFPIFLGVRSDDGEFHALAILGYKLANVERKNFELMFVGDKIDILYIHDDNIGPFAKFNLKYCDEKFRLTCEDEYLDLTPNNFAIPLYKKIRFPLIDIKIALISIRSLLLKLEFLKNIAPSEILWDVYITNVNSLKNAIIQSKIPFKNEERFNVVNEFYPRFIWRCSLLIKGEIVIDLLADATEAKNSNPFFKIIFYIDEMKDLVATKIGQRINDKKKLIEHFKRSPGLFEFFCVNFGIDCFD